MTGRFIKFIYTLLYSHCSHRIAYLLMKIQTSTSDASHIGQNIPTTQCKLNNIIVGTQNLYCIITMNRHGGIKHAGKDHSLFLSGLILLFHNYVYKYICILTLNDSMNRF